MEIEKKDFNATLSILMKNIYDTETSKMGSSTRNGKEGTYKNL